MPEKRQGRIDAATPDEFLADAVPATARTVLQCGAGSGWIATRLKQRVPGLVVYGTDFPDLSTGPATRGGAGAASGFDDLDGYHEVDLERVLPPLEVGSVDCIVYADVLPRFADPRAALLRQRALLSETGSVVCSVPNLQHHGLVAGILRGLFPYIAGTLLDPTYVRLFTSASVMQLLLDVGYAPNTVGRVEDDGAAALVVAGAPLFELLGVGAGDAERDMGTSRLIVRGSPLAPSNAADEVPMTFVACVNDDAQLDANLRRSPCLAAGGPHELLVFRDCASAAEGLNAGIERARHEFVVLVHQDVYLPEGWPARMVAQWRRAERAGGPIGIAGVFGVLDRHVPFDAIGHVVHGDRLLAHRSLPADVDGLDELLMVVPRDTPLRVEAALGWHLYGTDLALQAQQRALRVVVLDALCHHNSLTGRVPWKYRESERVLAQKWADLLPIHTNLSSIGAWLIDDRLARQEPALPEERVDGDGAAPAEVAELVTRLRREQVALNHELEQARLQVASMQHSPFWRARQAYVAARERLTRGR